MLSWLRKRGHATNISAEVKVALTEAGLGWVGYTQQPPPERAMSDLQALCALYGAKMLYNAQRCTEAAVVLEGARVLLQGADESGLSTPTLLANHLMHVAGVSLVSEEPAEERGRKLIRAELHRNRDGVPIVQTHFGLSVGPADCAISIPALWAWAVQQTDEAGMARLWYAIGLIPYYEKMHSEAHGRFCDLKGLMASSTYIVHMLAAGEASMGITG